MFDELDKQNTQNTIPQTPFVKGGASAKAQDIFSEVDKTVKPEALRPRDNSSSAAPSTVIPADDSWLKNKGLVAGLIFGGLLVVIVGGYFGLRFAIKGVATAKEAVVQDAIKDNQPKSETSNQGAESLIQDVTAPLSQPAITPSVDSDQDGLTDEKEATLGTNSNNPDTDGDGLTDREEAKVYSTDPLKADTDADGYPDGQEIKNGFNPKGPGQLLDINNQ